MPLFGPFELLESLEKQKNRVQTIPSCARKPVWSCNIGWWMPHSEGMLLICVISYSRQLGLPHLWGVIWACQISGSPITHPPHPTPPRCLLACAPALMQITGIYEGYFVRCGVETITGLPPIPLYICSPASPPSDTSPYQIWAPLHRFLINYWCHV